MTTNTPDHHGGRGDSAGWRQHPGTSGVSWDPPARKELWDAPFCSGHPCSLRWVDQGRWLRNIPSARWDSHWHGLQRKDAGGCLTFENWYESFFSQVDNFLISSNQWCQYFIDDKIQRKNNTSVSIKLSIFIAFIFLLYAITKIIVYELSLSEANQYNSSKQSAKFHKINLYWL